jgi:branched-chain amino acid transport system ATP-binding protein
MEQTQTDIILEGSDIDLSFGGIRSLDNVSFKVKKGEIFSIIGPNGAGKTCLLNCISGYYKPQKGKILFANQDLLTLKPHQIARLGISRTFQNPSLYAEMTALENLLTARYMHTRSGMIDAVLYFGRSRKEEMASRKMVEEIISITHIEELRSRPVSMLSYGQRKQVEIARSLAMEPRVILFDEPMSGLDDMMKEIVAELILRIQKQGVTVILVEHDMEVVMGLSQTVVVLDFGVKIAEGNPDEISHNERVAEAYLGGNGHKL